MDRVELVRAYLGFLGAADGEGAAGLFAENCVVDDGDGRRWEGRAGVARLVSGVPDGLIVDAPRYWKEDPDRLTAYGYLSGSERYHGKEAGMRWIFRFEGDQLVHLINTFVSTWDGPGSPSSN